MKLRTAFLVSGLTLALSPTGLAQSGSTESFSTHTTSRTDCPQIGVPSPEFAGNTLSNPPGTNFDIVPRSPMNWEDSAPSSNLPTSPVECVHSGYSDHDGDVWEYKIRLSE